MLVPRVRRFAQHLREVQSLWYKRAWKPDCFTIIHEFPDRKRSRAAAAPGIEFEKAPDIERKSKYDWRLFDGLNRYVQFAFCGRWFYVELPVEILGPNEGLQLVLQRNGFFYLRDKPDAPSAFSPKAWAKLVLEHDPVQKIYQSSEIVSAANDTAFIWFELWGLAIDQTLFAKSAYFHGSGLFHEDFPL